MDFPNTHHFHLEMDTCWHVKPFLSVRILEKRVWSGEIFSWFFVRWLSSHSVLYGKAYQFYDLSYQMSFGQVDFYPCCAQKSLQPSNPWIILTCFSKTHTVLRFFCKAISLFCVKNTHGDFIKEKNINAFLKYTTNNAMFPQQIPPPQFLLAQ